MYLPLHLQTADNYMMTGVLYYFLNLRNTVRFLSRVLQNFPVQPVRMQKLSLMPLYKLPLLPDVQTLRKSSQILHSNIHLQIFRLLSNQRF